MLVADAACPWLLSLLFGLRARKRGGDDEDDGLRLAFAPTTGRFAGIPEVPNEVLNASKGSFMPIKMLTSRHDSATPISCGTSIFIFLIIAALM